MIGLIWPALKKPLMLVLLLLTSLAVAQNGEDMDDDKPFAETEIICYAAKNKWVCAPADEKEKAHEKAMRLAAQSSDNSSGLNQDAVEIQPLESNNSINQQVQETPVQAVVDANSLEAAIKDFIPREDALQTAAASQQDAAPTAVNTPGDQPAASRNEQEVQQPLATEPVITAVPSANKPVVAQTAQPTLQSTNTAANNFSDWQRNYPNQWSFQVVGTSNRHHLNQFIIDKGINNGPYAVVRTQVNDADWWVVLSGLYDSREQALSQRSDLPAELAGNAWVRQIKTIVGQAD